MQSKTKKMLLIAALVVVVIVAVYFLFFRKSKSSTPTASKPTSPYDFTYTIPEETQPGLIPTNQGGDGVRMKTQLASKATFDLKVKALIDQIMRGAPDNDWYQSIIQSSSMFWTDEGGMSENQAVYEHARQFISELYYY